MFCIFPRLSLFHKLVFPNCVDILLVFSKPNLSVVKDTCFNNNLMSN